MQSLLTALASLATLLAASGPLSPSALASLSSAHNALASVSTAATPAPKPVVTQDLALSLGKLRDSMVNIICIANDRSLHSITGSGVIVDPRGIILTAAHIGQYFLLEEANPNEVTCVIRTGNPARTAYFARPIYVSPSWIARNPNTLTDESPSGTGENDLAFLAITQSATSTPLPQSFPYIPLATADPVSGQSVAIGGYAAQSLTTKQIETTFYPTLVFGNVMQRYTYASNTVDSISLGGSAVAQEGSSGGGVVNDRGQLLGIITTSTVSGDLLTRDIHAITVNHMRRSFTTNTDQVLDTYIKNESISDLVRNFTRESKELATELENAIRLSI